METMVRSQVEQAPLPIKEAGPPVAKGLTCQVLCLSGCYNPIGWVLMLKSASVLEVCRKADCRYGRKHGGHTILVQCNKQTQSIDYVRPEVLLQLL
jgi:hypothetical protein